MGNNNETNQDKTMIILIAVLVGCVFLAGWVGSFFQSGAVQ